MTSVRQRPAVDSPNRKGAIAEAMIAAHAIKAGAVALRPLEDHCRYDLVFDISSRLYRVQCKTARRQGEVLAINLVRSWHTPHGYVRNRYEAGEIDLIAAYCHELDRAFLLSFDAVPGTRGIQLRLSPPRNGQRAAIHYAADYELSGAVAQLGRAPAWHAGGRGFESHQLHTSETENTDESTTVGAHVFRNLFGHYMERAERGEEIVVTRRSRPVVVLGPVQPPPSSPQPQSGSGGM
jgi:prevent-host-death family protein